MPPRSWGTPRRGGVEVGLTMAARMRRSHDFAVPVGGISMRVLENFINGKWVKSGGSTLLDVKNPATGEVLAKVPLSTSEDVDAAVASALAAFPAWSATPPVQRARYLFKLKSLFDEH